MSSLFALCCLPSVKNQVHNKQKHDFYFFPSMFNKTIIIVRFGFCDIQNNQCLGKGYQSLPSTTVTSRN